MSQHDGVVDNGSGATVRADLNNLAAALLTQNSGTTAPSTTYANQVWVDTTNHLVKVRNEANSAWIIRARTDAEGMVTKSAGFTVALADYGKTFYCTAALTVAFTAAATLTDGFWCRVINNSTGAVTLDPNSSETINGSTTLLLRPGEGAYIETNGTLFRAILGGPGLVARKSLGIAGVISPAQLTANTDDWAPTGYEDCSVIRFSTDASRNITGLSGGWDGRVVLLENVGAQSAVLMHNVTSTAANRFYCPGSTDLTLTANSAVVLRYDATDSRWRIISPPASSGGGMVKLASYAPATASSVDITSVMSSTYQRYRIVGFLRPATDDVELWVRTDDANGASFDAGASDYDWTNVGDQASAGGFNQRITADTKMMIGHQTGTYSVGNASGEGIVFDILITAQQAGTMHALMSHKSTFVSATGYTTTIAGGARRLSTTVINAVRLLFESGNIASGVVVIYGLTE